MLRILSQSIPLALGLNHQRRSQDSAIQREHAVVRDLARSDTVSVDGDSRRLLSARTDHHRRARHGQVVAYARSSVCGQRLGVLARCSSARRCRGGPVEGYVYVVQDFGGGVWWDWEGEVRDGEAGEVLEVGCWCLGGGGWLGGLLREEVDQWGPGVRAWLAHCFDGEELEVAVGLACAAVVAGVEEGEEALRAVGVGAIAVGVPGFQNLVCSL